MDAFCADGGLHARDRTGIFNELTQKTALLAFPVQVQDAMSRITLDVIMATGFDLRWDAADLDRPCPLLDDMHFLMAETFRYHDDKDTLVTCMQALSLWLLMLRPRFTGTATSGPS